MSEPAAYATASAAAALCAASAAEGLRDRHTALQAALDLIDQGFTLIDADLRLVAWNRAFLRLLDFPERLAYVGAPFEDFMRYNAERGEYGPGDVAQLVAERMAAARSFAAHDFERTRPDGTVLRVRGFPMPGLGFATLYSDITAQKAAERQIQQHAAVLEQRVAERTAELRRSEAQMRLVTDSIPALVAYFDRERNYRYINRGYTDWFGLDPAYPQRISAREYLGAATYAGIRHNVARALAGEPVSFEYEVDVLGGRRLTARTTLIPEIGPDGAVAGCFELTFDISAQKHSQELLLRAQKMEALGQLTGGLAHDFNNMLTVIIGNLGALVDARAGDADVAEFAVPAMEAARRGAGLIRSLLGFARRGPLEPEVCDVGEQVERVDQLLRRTLPEGLQLRLQLPAAPLQARVDPHRLQDALVNLILNARDADARQVTLRLGLDRLDATRAAALQGPAGEMLRLEVVDDGRGMDAATRSRVFEPFFTTKRAGSGTGLGLSMVYGFARQSGGAVDLESQPGAGCRVSIWLPRVAAGAQAADGAHGGGAAGAQEGAAAGEAVRPLALLVDDDPQVRRVVRRVLLEGGYAVLEAESGPEALPILQHTPGIALLLSDVVMPGQPDGWGLAAQAQALGVPRVLLMSGYSPEPAAVPAAWPLLAKPFTPRELTEFLTHAESP